MSGLTIATRLAGLTAFFVVTVLAPAASAQTQTGQPASGLQVRLVLAVLAATILLAIVVRMMLRANRARIKPVPEATEEDLNAARTAILKAPTSDALCAETAHQAVATAGATGSVVAIDGIQSRSGTAFEVPKELVMSLHNEKVMVATKTTAAVPIINDGSVVGLIAARGAHARNLNSLGEYASEAYEAQKQPTRLEAAAARANSPEVDGLTGIANRRRFDQDLAKVARVDDDEDGGEVMPVSLAMFDIDNFSYYNDAHGKQAGNEVLRSIAGHIASNLRESDVVYRYSGVRFVALLPGADIENAYVVVERIRNAVEADSYSGEEVQPLGRVTMSVGIANAAADSAADLVGAADAAVAKARAEGRDTVMIEADIK